MTALLSLLSMALRFSSRCQRVLLLGIGMMSAPWDISQVSGVANRLGVKP